MLSEYLAVAIRNSRLYGEVAETKQSLERLIRSAGDAIISLDAGGRIQGWNPAADRIFGWMTEDAMGRPHHRPPARGAATGRPAPRCPASIRCSSFEVTTKHDEAPRSTSPSRSRRSRAATARIEGMLAIVRDTTAQRELEAQMHQSEKLTALGQMAGGIAHDFNNLLQAILGYAQLMGKNPANVDVVRRGLDVIEKAATGGAETVRRIQKFARLRPEEAFVALDLDQVIHDALAITRPRWEEKKIRARPAPATSSSTSDRCPRSWDARRSSTRSSPT